MALAILFDELLRTGQVASMADLARICRVSRARVSQIVGLLNLAPAVQEELLAGKVVVTESEVRAGAIGRDSTLCPRSSCRILRSPVRK
jgi:hypothetical protein